MSLSHFSDVNTFWLIYSRTGLPPLTVSHLILQLKLFKMNLNQTPVTIKFIAKQGLSLFCVGALCMRMCHKLPRWKRKMFFYPSLIMCMKCYNRVLVYLKWLSLGQKALLHRSTKITGSCIASETKMDFSLLWAAVWRMHLFLQSPPGSFHLARSKTEVALQPRLCCLLE